MARGTVYLGKRNKGLSSTFQPSGEGRSVQWSKHCDKHGDKDEDNSPINVDNVHNTSSQKCRQKTRKEFCEIELLLEKEEKQMFCYCLT